MNAVDPRVRALIDLAPFAVPAAAQSPAAIRAGLRAAVRTMEGPRFTPEVVGRVEDRVVRGRDGEIPLRVYQPDGAPSMAVVYVHGGGFVAGDTDTHDKITRRLCAATGAAVVSVDYRLAPEHPFPAGLRDCWDGLRWTSARYPGVPLLVAGDSAGGALAACTALQARDAGGPVLAGQVLLYPVIDDDADTATMRAYASGYLLTRADLVTYCDWYLGRGEDHGGGRVGVRGKDPAGPRALPGFAASLAGLPPTVIATAGFDPLRSANESWAARLRAAGVRVVLHSHPALTHGWADYFPVVPAARRAIDELAAAVRDLVAPAPSESTSTSASASAEAHAPPAPPTPPTPPPPPESADPTTATA